MLRPLINKLNSLHCFKSFLTNKIGPKMKFSSDVQPKDNQIQPSGMPVDIVQATLKDTNRVFQFLLDHFYPDEPLNSALGRMPTAEEESPVLKSLGENVSFIAVERNDPTKMLGLSLNRIIKQSDWPSYFECEEKRAQVQKNKGNKIFVEFLLCTSKIMSEVLEKKLAGSKTDKAFDITILSVDQACRRRNIANLLMCKCIDCAKANQLRWMTIECTSLYSAKLAEKHGFKVESETLYADYKEDGKVLIHTKPPHTAYRLLMKDLNIP